MPKRRKAKAKGKARFTALDTGGGAAHSIDGARRGSDDVMKDECATFILRVFNCIRFSIRTES